MATLPPPPVPPIQELITDMVTPTQRAAVKINLDHITMLHGTKNVKLLDRKRPTHKSKTLSRRECAELGLYTLPTKQMRYEDALPLHRLWRGYMREHCQLRDGDMLPQPHDRGYDAFATMLAKCDFHGAKFKVIETKCPSMLGVAGIVVMESKNTLKLLGKDNTIRTVPKSQCVFGMRLGNMQFTIFGNHMCHRPAERSTKKCKSYIKPFQ